MVSMHDLHTVTSFTQYEEKYLSLSVDFASPKADVSLMKPQCFRETMG